LKKSKHAVETKNLSISWGEVNVLNQINFELNDGEKLAIVGPSGSGKSTILKILAHSVDFNELYRNVTIHCPSFSLVR